MASQIPTAPLYGGNRNVPDLNATGEDASPPVDTGVVLGGKDPKRIASAPTDVIEEPASGISIGEYMAALSKAHVEFQDATYEALQKDPQFTKELFRSFIQTSTSLDSLGQSMQGAQSFFSLQGDVNNFIAFYNSLTPTINTLTNDVNRAAQAFNWNPWNPQAAKAYRDAVKKYNEFFAIPIGGGQTIGSAIDNYNSIIAPLYNAQTGTLASLNSQRVPYLAPIDLANQGQAQEIPIPTHLDLDTFGLTRQYLNPNPLPSPVSTLPSVPTQPLPISDVIALAAIFGPVFQQLIQPLNPSNTQADIEAAFLAGIAAGAASGTGPSAAYLSFLTGQSTQILSTMLSLQLWGLFAPPDTVANVIKPMLQNQVQLLTLNVIAQMAYFAGVSMGQDVANSDHPAIDLIAAFAIVQAFNHFIKTTIIADSVTALIDADPNLSKLPDDIKKKLVEGITAIVNLSSLKVTLAQLALATEAPALLAQVLANVAGAPDAAVLFLPTAVTILSGVLGDPVKMSALSNVLVGVLIEQANFNPSLAPSIVDKVIAGIVLQTFEDETALRAAITDAFIKEGIAWPVAATLANEAINFINNEIAMPFLSNPFVDAAVYAIINEMQKAAVVAGKIADLANQIKNNPLILTVLTSTLQGHYATIRDFQVALINNLVSHNAMFPMQAASFANALVSLLAPPSVDGSQNPLQAIPPTVILSPLQLAEALGQHVYEKWAPIVGNEQALVLAAKAYQTVVGASSLITLFNAQIAVLQKLEQHAVIAQFFKDIAVMMQPNAPSDLFSRRVLGLVVSTFQQTKPTKPSVTTVEVDETPEATPKDNADIAYRRFTDTPS